MENVLLILEFAFSNWRWWLEILILAMAFYGAYRILRGTRGANILIGLGLVIGVLAFGVFLLNLDVLRQVLVGILTILPIGAIIIFQQELRQALAELALGHGFQSNRGQERIIGSVVAACESLAEKRHGALIALGGSLSPEDVLQSGVLLDAEVSSELLETIFYPKTVLHDGAVWIRNGRIVAAACIFPLTRREDLHRIHGLRHRAALGISEETDATVVVVSEETGSLALCHKGILKRPITPDQLRQSLTDHFSSRKKRHDSEQLSASQPAGELPQVNTLQTGGTWWSRFFPRGAKK